MTLWTVAHQASAHGIFQARILEWVAIPPAGDLPDPGIEYSAVAEFSALAGAFFTTEPTGKPFIWDLGEIKKIKSDFFFFIILDLGNKKKNQFLLLYPYFSNFSPIFCEIRPFI